MARTQNTAAVAQPSREELAQQIAAQLLAGIRNGQQNAQYAPGLREKLYQKAGEVVADFGNGFGHITAGFEAAGQNYAISREAARLHHQKRTAQRALELARMQLEAEERGF